jgi:hypothetical protein
MKFIGGPDSFDAFAIVREYADKHTYQKVAKIPIAKQEKLKQ